jgi:hypothetical protein
LRARTVPFWADPPIGVRTVSARPYVPGDWRYYPRPDAAAFIGTAAIGFVRGVRGNTNDRSRKRQRELLRSTGFAGGYHELGYAVQYELGRLGYHPSIASYAGHLCSVGGRFNFQGNARVSRLMRRSLRSAQRYRAQLEADGLLSSHTLEPGDMIDGQRSPVSRAQVVRDLSGLRALAIAAPQPKPPHRRRRRKSSGPSAAEVPPPPVERMSTDELRAQTAAWLTANPIASAAPRTPRNDDPVRVPVECDPSGMATLERYLEWLDRPERPPDPPG